jgi:hypothetical protein
MDRRPGGPRKIFSWILTSRESKTRKEISVDRVLLAVMPQLHDEGGHITG